MRSRTAAYWPTRILLAVGVIATALAIGFAVFVAVELQVFAPLTDTRPDVLGLPQDVARSLAAAGLAVAGLVWMVRIFRGPRDEPPAWRYRR
jgi:hypothetical protein